MISQRFLFVGLLIGVLSPIAGAAAESEFALVSGKVRVNVSSWGPDCGDKPKSQSDKAGTLYDLRGGQLIRRGKARIIDERGVCRSATGLPTIIETQEASGFRCKSPEKKGTQAFGRVSRIMSGDTATVTHAFEYTWRLHGSQCEVEQTGKWVLKRKSAPGPKPKLDVCATPGPPTRLSPRMATNVNLRPTSSTRLRVVALDDNGCVTPAKISWRTTHGRIASGPRLVLKKAASDSRVTVTATAGSAKTTLNFSVSETRNLSGLAPAYPEYSSSTIGQEKNANLEQVRIAMTVESGSDAGSSTPWGKLVVSFVALCLGSACVWFAVRLRSRRQEEDLNDLI